MEKDARIDWLGDVRRDEKRGSVYISGERHTIVHSDSFRLYREGISEIIGDGADAVLYMAGKRHGENFVKVMLKKSAIAGFARRFRWGRNRITEKVADVLSQYGFGATSIEKMDLDKESIIVIKNSCIASSYKKRQEGPVCSYISGLLAGGAKAIAGGDYNSVETHCIAKGDKNCRFVIKKEK